MPVKGPRVPDSPQNADTLTIEVVDGGSTTPAWQRTLRGGHGLVGMRERVEALGGTFHAGPGTGVGWAVRATLPLAGPDRR